MEKESLWLSLHLRVGTLLDFRIKLGVPEKLVRTLVLMIGVGAATKAYLTNLIVKTHFVLRIQNLDSLCRRIGIPEEKLSKVINELTSNSSALYGEKKQRKETGEIRIINPPRWKLKKVQSR